MHRRIGFGFVALPPVRALDVCVGTEGAGGEAPMSVCLRAAARRTPARLWQPRQSCAPCLK